MAELQAAAEEYRRSLSDYCRIKLFEHSPEKGIVRDSVLTDVADVKFTDADLAEIAASPRDDRIVGKHVDDRCTHRASHARTIREGEACKGCGGTTW